MSTMCQRVALGVGLLAQTQGAESLLNSVFLHRINKQICGDAVSFRASTAIHAASQENMDNIISYEALYKSMQKCKRGVMWKDSVAHFVLNSVEEIIKLQDRLKAGEYTSHQLKPFVTDGQHHRTVMGVSFRDRVFQRSLNDNAIYPQITKSFIYDNSACQKNKGTDFSRNRLVCFLQRFYRKHGTNGYVLQCDISGYYPNMRHEAVEAVFKRYLDPEIYEVAIQILHKQYQGEVGYYAGSQMIQIAGIAILNDLDHYIKERLGIRYYIRYMDDFILIHNDHKHLEHCQQVIAEKLSEIGFELHPKKTRIYPITEGIKFLGFEHYLKESGKVVQLVISKNVKMERLKLRRLVNRCKKGYISQAKVDECYKSWKAHASKGNSHNLLKRMDAYYKGLWL